MELRCNSLKLRCNFQVHQSCDIVIWFWVQEPESVLHQLLKMKSLESPTPLQVTYLAPDIGDIYTSIPWDSDQVWSLISWLWKTWSNLLGPRYRWYIQSISFSISMRQWSGMIPSGHLSEHPAPLTWSNLLGPRYRWYIQIHFILYIHDKCKGIIPSGHFLSPLPPPDLKNLK